MPNYNDKSMVSLYEFFHVLEEEIAQLEATGKYTPEKINEYKTNQLAIQFNSIQYVRRNVSLPDRYPLMDIKESLEVAKALFPCVHEIFNFFMKNTEGKSVATKIDLHFTLAIANYFRNRILRSENADNCSERIVYGVREGLIRSYNIALNAPKKEFIDSQTGIVKSDKVLNRYPKVLYVLQDEVVQKVFKNGSSDKTIDRQGGVNHYSIKAGNKNDAGIIQLYTTASADDLSVAEKKFSYYDWAVMEAVASIYDDAIERNQDNNGEIIVDIKSIHRVLNHGRRMSQEKLQNIADCELTQSLKRLMGNYIKISEPSGNYEGNVLEGTIDFVGGKHCVRIKSEPVLLQFAKQNGRKYYCKFDRDDLNLKDINYNEERIAIYRYLMQRTNEIYGSYKKDDKHKNAIKTNSIPLSNVIKAVYPDIRTQYPGDSYRSKKRDITENVSAILGAMKDKGFIDDYIQNQRGNDLVFELVRK